MNAGFSTQEASKLPMNWVRGPEQEVSLNKKKKAVNHSCYPDEVIERLARCFYPAILESFNNEEDQKAFAVWQAEQARCSAKEKQDVPDGERPAIHRQLFSSWVRPSGRTLFCLVSKSSYWQNWPKITIGSTRNITSWRTTSISRPVINSP